MQLQLPVIHSHSVSNLALLVGRLLIEQLDELILRQSLQALGLNLLHLLLAWLGADHDVVGLLHLGGGDDLSACVKGSMLANNSQGRDEGWCTMSFGSRFAGLVVHAQCSAEHDLEKFGQRG